MALEENFVKRPFIPVFISYLSGINFGDKFFVPYIYLYILALFLILHIFYSGIHLKKKLFFQPLFLFFILGMIFISPVNEKNVEVKTSSTELYLKKGKISGEIDAFIYGKKGRQDYDFLISGMGNKNLNGIKVRLSIYNQREDQRFAPGDRIFFISKVKPFSNFKNPLGFDYKSYMRRKGYLGRISISFDDVEKKEGKPSFDGMLFELRRKVSSIIDSFAREKDTALILKALVTGEKIKGHKSLEEHIRRSGTAHFMAISGLHVGMVFSFFFFISRYIFSFIPFILKKGWLKKSAYISAILMAFLYSSMAGFMPSTTRAFVVLLLICGGYFLDRKVDPLNILFACAFFISFFSPAIVFDAGFILSFAAVFSILILFKLFPSGKKGWKEYFKIAFKTCVAASIGTLPLSIYFFSYIPIYGIILSFFLVFIFSFMILPFAFLGVIFSFISVSLAKIFFFISESGVKIFLESSSAALKLPFSSVDFGINILELFIIYGFIVLGVLFIQKNLRFKRFNKIIFAFLVFASAADISKIVYERFLCSHGRIISFDVGKGNSTLVIFPGGKTLLVDAGGIPYSDFDTGKSIIAPYLLKNKIFTIDYAVLTHGHADHYKGFFYLMKHFHIKNFFFNHSDIRSGAVLKLINFAERKKIYSKLKHVDLNNAGIDFLFSEKPFKEENNNSLLVKVNIFNKDILFTGDLMKKGEAFYFKNPLIKNMDILMIPHHGSPGSFEDNFIKSVNPKIGILSGFYNKKKNHDMAVSWYGNSGVKIHDVNKDGAFEADIFKDKILIKNSGGDK